MPKAKDVSKSSKMEVEFRVLTISLKATIIVHWFTFCMNLWQLSFWG